MHERGAGVAEQVATAFLPDVGGVDVIAHELGQAVGLKGFGEVGQEQDPVVDQATALSPMGIR